MPLFLRKQNFWNRILDPLAQYGTNARFSALRIAAASHRWGLDDKGFNFSTLSTSQIGLVDVAQSILERGAWTLPTWRLEQYLAELAANTLGWEVTQDNPDAGGLGFTVAAARQDAAFQNCLTSARWECEAAADAAKEIWANQEADELGSEAERQFLEDVLVPVLGFPLLDYLRLQPNLLSMGMDPLVFAGQRADFCVDTGRGLRLVIEVDGGQHIEAGQRLLDRKRDEALRNDGWSVWRVPTSALDDTEALRGQLRKFLDAKPSSTHWGIKQKLAEPRSKSLLTCVWGATAVSRIQYLLLEALRRGTLPWNEPWKLCVLEADTQIAKVALDDFQDWFGRLRELFSESAMPAVEYLGSEVHEDAQLVLDLSVIQPHRPVADCEIPVAWSRPANCVAPSPKRKFATRMLLSEQPSLYLVESFVQDLLRKPGLREGQFEIISRILMGMDVIGLLPTGGGKSLTYQLCGLLVGGLTVYVSPLKSLLQDQRERLLALGVDLVQEISSALSTSQKLQAGQLLTAGGIRFLLIAPERFLIDGFRTQLAQFRVQFGEVSQVVIDECHCVSEWGHDFRPAYLSLSRIVKERTKRLEVSAPLIALTGTASSIVLADVKRELGVLDDSAIVRAKRLDRPEISMSCVKLRGKDKADALKETVHDFLINATNPADGLLIFSRFIGGLEGVVGISATLLGVVPNDTMRFYTGTHPKWRQYAAFVSKRKSKEISEKEALSAMPVWALSPSDGKPLDWEQVKAKVQSDFISGLPDNYRVLVATNAFGMGIDKPSIRRVVHYMTPQSPEAYYQEVGRAGRDKRASTAILLFSDEEPGVTDKILDPGASINEAKEIYKAFIDKHPYQGGDFIKTFYFHQNSFSGPEEEAKVITRLLKELRRRIASDSALVLEYIPDSPDLDPNGSNAWRYEKNQEYGIVRLIILGVVRDYTKDYNKKQFELSLEPGWEEGLDDPDFLAGYYADQFRIYAHRYQTYLRAHGEEQIRAAATIQEIEDATALAIVNFVYEQIERKRRQASRQMLELARVGAKDQEAFRERLNNYLQVSEKFTKELEVMAQSNELQAWHDLLSAVDSRDELRELHGACQRVLESFPTHPGLLAISAATRLKPTKDDLMRSEEELSAALRYSTEVGGKDEAKDLGGAIAAYIAEVDETLADTLHGVFGLWLMKNGWEGEAVQRFFFKKKVRDYWMGGVLRDIRDAVPAIREL